LDFSDWSCWGCVFHDVCSVVLRNSYVLSPVIVMMGAGDIVNYTEQLLE
jgi:hypothetical protein